MAVAVAVADHECRAFPLCRRCQTDYQPAEVELLLTAYFHGGTLDREEQIEPGAPKTKANPARMGNNVAHMIDVERAWRRARLSRNQRVALYLRHERGDTLSEIADWLGLADSTVSEMLQKATAIMAAAMNGRTYKEQVVHEREEAAA